MARALNAVAAFLLNANSFLSLVDFISLSDKNKSHQFVIMLPVTEKSHGMKITDEEKALFQQSMQGISQFKQDKVRHAPKRQVSARFSDKRHRAEQADHSHYFSEQYQPLLPTEGPVRYIREQRDLPQLKKLKRGDYNPEIFLDLHGLTLAETQRELGALIHTCRQEHLFCASVMTGYGKKVLKQQLPYWLAQHPHIIAFHQAPKQYGGDAALLVLIETLDQREMDFQ